MIPRLDSPPKLYNKVAARHAVDSCTRAELVRNQTGWRIPLDGGHAMRSLVWKVTLIACFTTPKIVHHEST
jgi:hypothetical protein